MPLITLEAMRARLDWHDVREQPMPEYGMRWFRAMPRDQTLPSIDFLFDDQVEFLQQLGSGQWHCHPNEIDDAVTMARDLIHHNLCILEERSRKDEYRASGPVAPGEVLRTIGLDAGHFVRHFFGVPAVREEIDFSRYVKGRHIYFERQAKRESDAAWESIGRPPPNSDAAICLCCGSVDADSRAGDHRTT